MKEYYYMVNLPEKLSEISVNDFCEVFEDLTAENGACPPSPNGKIHPKICTIGVKTA